jgi:ATP-dependent Lon protease
MNQEIIFIDHADTDVGLEKLRRLKARRFNCLVFNISDDNLHNEKGDLREINDKIRHKVERDVLPEMKRMVAGGDVVVVTSDHGFVELEDQRGLPIDSGQAETQVFYRYLYDDAKILAHLSDRVILKPLTRWNEAYKEFPRYVIEYLCARYVDAKAPLPGQQKIDRILEEHYVESGKKELIKSRIREQGEYTFLGQLTLSYDQRTDHYWADVPALGDNHVRVSDRVKRRFDDILLTTGAWGTMRIEFDGTYELRGRKYPFCIAEFTPFKVTRLSLDDYIEKRRPFTTQEWIDLLIQTVDYNPYRLDERVKHLLRLRLVPFVESNYNVIELGPRETGKTYMYKNTSPQAFVVSSGKSTPATLFYHKAWKRVGVIGVKDVVVFDEVAREGEGEPKFDAETIDTLKMFMQSGQYTRDNLEFTSQCSIVLGGNIGSDTERRTPVDDYHPISLSPYLLS